MEESSAWVQGNGSDGEKQFVDFDFAVLAMGSQYAGTELWKAHRFHAISMFFFDFFSSSKVRDHMKIHLKKPLENHLPRCNFVQDNGSHNFLVHLSIV